MNDKKLKKYERLNARLNELNDLNKKIGRLAFFLNEDENVLQYEEEIMDKQLEHMIEYKKILEERIKKGVY